MHHTSLKCTECGMEYPESTVYTCRRCGGVLDVRYNYAEVKVTREILTKRRSNSIWKYREFLPVKAISKIVSLQEGGTPLFKSQVLGMEFGLRELFFKDESRNPTGSFKDRGMSVAVSRALEENADSVMIASSGNAAASAAAYSTRACIPCYVLIEEEAPTNKILQAVIYGAKAAAIKGLLEEGPERIRQLFQTLHRRLGSYNVTSWAPFNPYPIEGLKTISYEIWEQIGCKSPDVVIVPVGGGDNLSGQWKGYKEFCEMGLIDDLPRMIGVQPEGSAPLVKSWMRRDKHVEPIQEVDTIASGLASTFSGSHALQAIYESGGAAITVSDTEIVQAEKELARKEGIWAEPAGAAAVAAIPRLKEQGFIEKDETAICVITGGGFKNMNILEEMVRKPPTVKFEAEQIIKLWKDISNHPDKKK